MNDLANLAYEAAMAGNRMLESGINAERAAMRPRYAALVDAYDRAKADPRTQIPTYLEVLIEDFRALAVNAYATETIKRDMERPQWERELATGAADIPNGR